MNYYRIDDRLIHGQVVTSWTRYYNLNNILIVDNQVATDDIQKRIIEMVTPSNVNVLISTIEEAYQSLDDLDGNTMVLVKTPLTIIKLLDKNIAVNEVIVGGMQYSEGKRKVSSAVSINEEEEKAFNIMLDNNVDVFLQMIPTEKKRELKDFL